MPLCNFALLLILTIRLASIPEDGLPPDTVYEHIFTYLSNAIKHLHISFDLSMQEGADLYQSQIKDLIHNLEHSNLAKCVLIIHIILI
jgi:hypothetical protein